MLSGSSAKTHPNANTPSPKKKECEMLYRNHMCLSQITTKKFTPENKFQEMNEETQASRFFSASRLSWK
jgi:hypothetical protein